MCQKGMWGQQGAVLLVALIVVLVMALLSAAAIQNATLQTRMAANMQDQNIAFNAAEDALLVAERWLLNNSASIVSYSVARPETPSVYNGIANALSGNEPFTQQDILHDDQFNNWVSHSFKAVDYGARENSELNQQPLVTIEALSAREYLILVFCSGASGKTQVVLRSVVVK